MLAPVVIAVGSVAVASQAGAAVDLPDKTPDEVLALLAAATEDTFSGEVEQSADLGLPALPEGMTGDGADLGAALEMLTGTRTARVFVDGPERARIQVLDTLAERDVIRNGADVWFWDSAENSVVHVTLPDNDAPAAAMAASMSPTELADALVAAAEPSSDLAVGQDAVVAGRPAYEVILTPRTADTLVGTASIAVDAETGLPLAVTVYARGQEEPAFRVAFTSIDLGTPDAARFDFTPPPGATVEDEVLPAHPGPEGGAPEADPAALGTRPTVIGTGWDAVVVMPSDEAGTASLLSDPLLAQVSSDVDGGRYLSTALLGVLVTDDGRVLAGAVPLSRLQAVAADPAVADDPAVAADPATGQ